MVTSWLAINEATASLEQILHKSAKSKFSQAQHKIKFYDGPQGTEVNYTTYI